MSKDIFGELVNEFITLYLQNPPPARETAFCPCHYTCQGDADTAELSLDTVVQVSKERTTWVFRVSCPCGAQLCERYAPSQEPSDGYY